MAIVKKPFGPEGNGLYLFELTNAGMYVSITNFGAAVVSIKLPGADGLIRDVALGFDGPEGYAVNKPHLGVIVGRFANRIKNGRFTLDGNVYQLEKNDGENHLHGAGSGFGKRVWEVSEAGDALVLTLESPDGDGGYPGNLYAEVVYSLKDDYTLRIDYKAKTDTKTICNLTNHSYFNFNGSGDILGHEMQIFADRLTSVGPDLMPDGKFMDVTGTPYDFREAKSIGRDIEAAGGYDHNYVLNTKDGAAARVYSKESGISMTVKTNSPGMQFYTGNFLDGSVQGKGGVFYKKHSGFCLETQFFPDSVNQPNFPSCVVEKGKPQNFYTEFIFAI